MKPILKRVHSPDVPNLKEYIPADPASFAVLIQAFFGPDSAEGEESFDILVCSPDWLASELRKKNLIVGRHRLIVAHWDLHSLRTFLGEYASDCAGCSWNEVAEKLSRLGK